MKTPARDECGRASTTTTQKLSNVRQSKAHTLEIAESAADSSRETRAKAHIHSKPKREAYVAPAARTENGYDRWMGVGSKCYL